MSADLDRGSASVAAKAPKKSWAAGASRFAAKGRVAAATADDTHKSESADGSACDAQHDGWNWRAGSDWSWQRVWHQPHAPAARCDLQLMKKRRKRRGRCGASSCSESTAGAIEDGKRLHAKARSPSSDRPPPASSRPMVTWWTTLRPSGKSGSRAAGERCATLRLHHRLYHPPSATRQGVCDGVGLVGSRGGVWGC